MKQVPPWWPTNIRCHSTKFHCTTSQKVAVWIPNVVFGILHWRNPSCHAMALVLTQPLSEMSTRNISWRVKVAGA